MQLAKSHRQKQGILALPKTQLYRNTLEQEFDGQAPRRIKKRGIYEVFSESHIGETLAVPRAVGF